VAKNYRQQNFEKLQNFGIRIAQVGLRLVNAIKYNFREFMVSIRVRPHFRFGSEI
jgi:hypothetical protein